MNLGKLIFLLVLSAFIAQGCAEDPQYTKEEIPHLDSLLLRGIESTYDLKFEEAQSDLSQLLLESNSRQSTKYQVLANLNLGNLYHHFNLDEEALKYFFQSLELSENSDQKHLLNAIYNNIGIIYAKNKAFAEAEQYFRLALQISRDQNLTSKEGMNLINLGIVLGSMGNEAEAIDFLNQSLEIFKDLNDSTHFGTIENSLGNIYYGKGDYVVALQYYRNAFQLTSQKGPVWYSAEAATNLGKTYLQFNQLDSAKKYADLARTAFEELDDTKNLIEANMILSNAERKAGNHLEALDYYEKALQLKDKLIEEKTSKWVSERQMNYEFGKKEKEMELLRLNSERQQTVYIVSAIVGTLILILLVLILRIKIQNLRQNNIILGQEKKVIELTAEKDAANRERMEQELINKEQINRVERDKLQQEIEFRDRELITKALHLVNKNETISAIYDLLARYDSLPDDQKSKAVSDVKNMLRFEKNLDDDWNSFKLHFEEVHPNFFAHLRNAIPDLNSGDLRMCAYLRLDLNTKEIAKIFNISPDSVRKRKQRLREKLNLEVATDLTEWLRTVHLAK